MDTEIQQFPPQRPLEAHARIEADLFCDQCGYNLYTQAVRRDERLGILIVRCPECGRFQPAGVASNAQKLWLSRFSSILIAFWCLFLLAIIVLGGMGLGGLQVAHVESLTSSEYIAPGGVNAYRQWDAQAQKVIWYSSETGKPIEGQTPEWRRTFLPMADVFRDKVASLLIVFLMLLAPLVFGGLLATLMWHIPRRRYWIGLLLPFIAAVCIIASIHINESDRGGKISMVAAIVGAAAIEQASLMLIGALLGRTVARFFATLLVPPRPRQAIAFLWTVDGKPPPSVK